ncbi:MAG: SusD/RagB family nutrient-binding outer membrane lipoprotein [Balneolaceae bacterium]
MLPIKIFQNLKVKRMKKNNYFYTSWMVAVFIMLTSCDAGFDAMNTDKTSLTSVEPALQLNNAIMASALGGDQIRCESSIVKQQMRIFTGVGACGNFNVDARETSSSNWDNIYETRLRNLIDAQRNTDPDSNLYQMIRIWKAYSFMILTDTYGDVPYGEAGLGFLEGIVFPDYDTQEFVYTSDQGILEELANASAALSASMPEASRDLLYDGDVTQWKRLGYSLLLRAAMRLSKVQPDLAEEYVGIAVAGGLMQSNEDNAIIRHTAEYVNSVGSSLNGGQSHYQYLVEDFVDYLSENDDPRLGSIAVRYPGATGAGDQTESNADRSPGNQVGMPMGYDNSNINPVAEAAGLTSFMAYSQVDRTRIMDPQAPSFLITYSLQQLLLAEAAQRNWFAGDASALYESGIEAHMQQFAEYGEDTAIGQNAIDGYIQANPLEPGRELELINTQYWFDSYLIPP